MKMKIDTRQETEEQGADERVAAWARSRRREHHTTTIRDSRSMRRLPVDVFDRTYEVFVRFFPNIHVPLFSMCWICSPTYPESIPHQRFTSHRTDLYVNWQVCPFRLTWVSIQRDRLVIKKNSSVVLHDLTSWTSSLPFTMWNVFDDAGAATTRLPSKAKIVNKTKNLAALISEPQYSDT